MSKIDIAKECEELITRFKRLKKAIDEENSLSPAQRAAVAAAQAFTQRVAAAVPAKEKLAKKADADTAQAQHLAEMLKSRGILGTRPPPRQPTDEEMFGHLVPDATAVVKAEQTWGNTINNWLTEATKPLNSRFSSPQEEQAYWDSIKVNGSGGGGDDSGY